MINCTTNSFLQKRWRVPYDVSVDLLGEKFEGFN